MFDPEPPRPVFVDPSGRRRRALRLVATAVAAAIAGYLVLMLLAVLGTPLPPAVQVPMPPGVDAAADRTPTSQPEPATGPGAQTPGQQSTTQRPRATTAPGPVVTTPQTAAPVVSTTPGRRSSRPPEPPGQSKVPTTPPGRH